MVKKGHPAGKRSRSTADSFEFSMPRQNTLSIPKRNNLTPLIGEPPTGEFYLRLQKFPLNQLVAGSSGGRCTNFRKPKHQNPNPREISSTTHREERGYTFRVC